MTRHRALLLPVMAALVTTGTLGDAQVPPSAPATPSAADGAPNDLDRVLGRYDAEERALRTELEGVGPKLDVTRQRIAARGRAYYRHVRAGLLPAGGGFDALVDHAARVERTRRALERDVALEASLRKQSVELASRLQRVRAERAPLEVHREAMLHARTALKEAEERRAAFTRAFESSSQPPDYMAIYGADVGPTDIDARAGFRALKGRLSFPVAGRAEVRRVQRAGVPGMEFAAAAGTAVRCVAPGRVVFADRVEDYGLAVVVDHGDHYNSVYANLGSTELHAGDPIAASGRIGTVGADGSRSPALYFELRKSGATIDPGPWLGL